MRGTPAGLLIAVLAARVTLAATAGAAPGAPRCRKFGDVVRKDLEGPSGCGDG